MQENSRKYIYNPNNVLPAPHTIIHPHRNAFTSKQLLKQPFFYEVYCPFSCKKIKIGVSKEGKRQTMEFNTTTNRRVSVYTDQNIRYLVNKHKPHKKVKKEISGPNAKIHIDIEDKGNIAVFNPYCLNPFQPLSFYTTQKIDKVELTQENLKFQNLPKIPSTAINMSGQTLYVSPDNQWIGKNPFFEEESTKQMTIFEPNNTERICKIQTEKLINLVENHLNYWLFQLSKIIELEDKGFQPTEYFKLNNNLDEIYEKISYYLNISEQIRCRLMNDHSLETYQKHFPYHPRLYSAFNRLASFYNYGNTKYSIKQLADQGFYNKSDMLQDLAFIEHADLPLPTAEEEFVQNANQLRQKILPYCRLERNLPFPNVNLNTSLISFHPQRVSQNEIIFHKVFSPYVLFADKNAVLSLWSSQMMVFKVFEFDYSKNYQTENVDSIIPIEEKDIKAFHDEDDLVGLFETQEPTKTGEKPAQIQSEELKPDPTMLEQIVLMGYGPSTAKKALITVKNESIITALDAIQQIQKQQKLKNKEKFKKNWTCSICTFKNPPGIESCEMCGEVGTGVVENNEEQNDIIEAQIEAEEKQKKEEEQKLAEEMKEKEKKMLEEKQKAEEEKKKAEQQYKKAEIVSINFLKIESAPISPFFVFLLLRKTDKSLVMRVFRIGMNKHHLIKYYRVQDEYLVSNFTKKIYNNKTLESLNELLQEASIQIEWGNKFFQGYSEKDWEVVECQTIEVEKSVSQVEVDGGKVYLLNEEKGMQTYEIKINDTLEKKQFTLNKIETENIPKRQEKGEIVQKGKERIIKDNSIEINEDIEEVVLEVVEHAPAGKWNTYKHQKNVPPNTIYSEGVIMSQFIPLTIEHFEGSLFSSKISSTAIMDKTQVYMSNYPNVCFVFKSIDSKPMLIETVSIISNTKRTQKIYPITQGLIFTANELCWFTLAKEKFGKMNKLQYEEWARMKTSSNSIPAFWEPVAFFEINGQVQFEVQYKRVAKYIFFLPTGIKRQNDKDEVVSLKVDFFGVKGRIEKGHSDEDYDLIENYKNEGQAISKVRVQEYVNNQWQALEEQKYLIRSASSPNTYHFNPKYSENYVNSSPLSVTTAYEIKLKGNGQKRKIILDSESLQHMRILQVKKAGSKQNLSEIKSFKELITMQSRLGGFDLENIMMRLNFEQLILAILQGGNELTQYENLLSKIMKIPNLIQPVYVMMSKIMPQLCDKKIEVSESGLRSYLRTYEKLMGTDEKYTAKSIYDSWLSLITYINQIKNKNYNILRNHYKIEELVLEPALFSKEYYRLIHPNYVEEDKGSSLTSEPQTPINNRLFINTMNNFNYIYYIDTLGHQKIEKLELYFPKIAQANKYKISLRIMEVNEEGEHQLYYRYFHEDFLYHLGWQSFKDTEIYKKTQINYLSLTDLNPSPQCRVLKIYFNMLLLTTKPHPRYKELPEPYIILPYIYSENYKHIPYDSCPLSKKLNEVLNEYPKQTKHNSTSDRMPPHKFVTDNKKMLYIIHEFKNKYTEETKSQFTETIDKITQNIMDKNIVEDCVKSIKISEYEFGYRGIDFGYTLMINLIKLFKKLPQSQKVDVKLMEILFETFVLYECGPIMNQTSALLVELYKRLDSSDKIFFVEGILDKYLGNFQRIKGLKMSEKYSVEKIMKFLYEIQLPTAFLYKKLQNEKTIFLVSILLKLALNNIDKFGIELTQIFEGRKFVRKIETHELINIAFEKCLWILENAKNVTSQILSEGLDLFLRFFPKKADSVNEKIHHTEEIKIFIEDMKQTGFWKLVFQTLTMKNEILKQKIHDIFKILILNINEKIQKGINSMLLEIIKKSSNSLYFQINQEISDQLRMGHLQTILEYLSLSKSSLFLDVDTAKQLLRLPLTPALWSLALKIIPRQDVILVEIIKNFKQQYYASLGREIMEFCEPLAGIKALQTNYVNWLQLIKEIRLEGKSIFQLFIDSLKKCSFGGRPGLTMALMDDVKELQITAEFMKLVLENAVKEEDFTDESIEVLISWYFLNKTEEAGMSPATSKLKYLSEKIFSLFEKVTEFPNLLPKFIKQVLKVKRESEFTEELLEKKQISSSSALIINSRFCQCFETLLNIFTVNDDLYSYLAFEINGLKHLLNKIDFKQKNSSNSSSTAKIPEEEFLISEGLIVSSNKDQPAESNDKVYSVSDLKEEQFANSVQLMKDLNEHTLTCNHTDWTVYKKGNKTKILYVPCIGTTYNEYPLHISLTRVAELRSIKIGFISASYEFAEKLVLAPSGVILEGSLDAKCFEPLGEMSVIHDDGYTCNGVKVFVLNFQKINSNIKVGQAVKGYNCHKLKYLRIIIKRPNVTFVEGQYSPLNGKQYMNLGCNISFLSILGDNVEKLPYRLTDICKQISKESALKILNNIISEYNPQTAKKISLNEDFIKDVKENFGSIKEHMNKYPAIVPNILFILGSNNEEMGDWIINDLLSEGQGEIQAKIINQIMTSSEDKVYYRLSIFLSNILKKLSLMTKESDIQSGMLYAKEVSFIESFCKTLEESYELSLTSSTIIQCEQRNIDDIINIYDKKYASPQIKTLIRLLINLLYIREPIKLSSNLVVRTLNVVWANCSEAKPYFYYLMGALLVDEKALNWLIEDNHSKCITLINDIKKSTENNNIKLLHCQMYLLMVISYHEKEFLREKKVHLELYNRVKLLIFEDSEILQFFTKVIQNLVLGDRTEEGKLAQQLIDDVDLLVKRKDPILQKFYVNILGLEKQVHVNLKGFNFDSNAKKESLIPTKILNKAHVKILTDKINKKIKFTQALQCNQAIRSSNFNTVMGIFNTPPFLVLMKLKLSSGKHAYCGCFNQGKSFRADEDSYYWEDSINYEKGSFIFWICEGESKFIQTNQSGQQMLSLFGGEEETDEVLIFYEKNSQILRIPFTTLNEVSVKLPNCAGCKVEKIEFYTGNVKSSTDPTKLLSISNKAKQPFSFYRHSNTYIFPERINMEKFMNILGVKGICKIEHKKVDSDEILGDFLSTTSDSIIDIEIVSEETGDQIRQDDGYIPIMNIFEKYSSFGGVNEVLNVGSKSIKDWKKADRRKNFQHYMEELKRFVDLPNFFNLFIKNHQSVTFLFEVASGMPDDPNSTRNWEQEETTSSKFIYKILSDIFKFDRSPKLRDMENYSGFCEIILQKLAEISKETVRELREQEQSDDDKRQGEQVPKMSKKKSEQAKKKKKGTGYGADSHNNSKWSASQWIEHRKVISEQILRVICIYVSFLDCEKPITDPRLSQIIKNSCLLPLLEGALRSGSLLDISKDAQLFKNYLMIIRNLAHNPSTVDCLLDLDKKYKPPQTQSIQTLLNKLNGIAEIFLQCLKSNKSSSETDAQASIALDIQKTHNFVEKAVKIANKASSSLTIDQLKKMPLSEAYRRLLEGLRFGYVDLKQNSDYKHFYASSISSNNPSTNKILRLSQELADLSNSLPCEQTNSIYVRCDKSRIDVVKILVMGSKDTPYSNGAFMFDMYCDDSYPQNPPKMSITTTGNGTIRFNPNLYSCGKVCLSLLGTWRGQASENWDAKLSTLLQLFISTQGITMSEDVYFNEPGFDSEQGTTEGEKKNEGYSNIVKLGNVRFAMNAQLKNPPKGFEEIIRRHFFIKKKEILEECEKWLEHAEKRQATYSGLVNDHNPSWAAELKQSKTKYKELLKKEVDELRTHLDKLSEPNLQEKEEEVTFSAQKSKKKMRAKEVKIGEIDVSYEPDTKEELKYEQEVMQDRWSRYIGAMGIEAVKKQSQSKILLVGLKTLGLEIAKNLVLSGLKQLTIVQREKLIMGSEEHFYMSDMKGKSISECLFKIKELNPYMLVNHSEEIPSVQGYTAVISTLSFGQSLALSEQCRKHKVKFIQTQTAGVSGTFFADFGQQFSINDTNGEQPFEGLIKNVSCQEDGIVTLLDGVKHPYEDGDYIVINKVEGMEKIEELMEEKSEAQQFYDTLSKQEESKSINGKVFKIRVISWNSFSIGDTRNFKPYIRNGICKNIKMPKKVAYKSFKQSLENFEQMVDQNLGIYDFEKMGDNFSIFACFQAYSDFKQKNSKLPRNWNKEDMAEFTEFVKKMSVGCKKSEEEVQSIVKFATRFSCIAEAQLPTIAAYMGGIVSQQIIKGITNKYTPIKQFFTFHINELVPELPQNVDDLSKRAIKEEEPFANLKIVIGKECFSYIEKMNTFIIGAGAIGCELLKNFAMINMGAEGTITVTDPDHIETSNLTRQFLFRQKHVKKPKSATASATLLQMNPFLKGHISARLDKVCEQTEDIYSDDFFENQTVVANALDNVRARVYVDKRCVKNSKPLFESGTLGPKGHVQVIVPNKTENYGNQNDPAEENQIPHCTLKMFPEQTVHCIEWSRDIFGKVFTLNPKALKKVIDTKDGKAVEGQEKMTVNKMIEYRPLNFDDCISEAVRKFYRYFRNNVRQLLHTYPLDMKTKEGKLFWELPKRPPKQISQIDLEDEVHQVFIASYAVLMAKIYGIPHPKNFRKPEERKTIMEIVKKVKVEQFVPSEEQSQKLQEMAEKEEKQKMGVKQNEEKMEENSPPKEEIVEIKVTSEILELKVSPEEFQKDEDSNGHIDLIYSMSNLRARNYGLNECTWIEAKLKAGRIMAALSTTTSVVAALQTIQIMKYVVGSKLWRNAFVNLAVPLVQISEPGQAPKHKIGNAEFTVWDLWEFKCETLNDLLAQLKAKYEVQGYNISTAEGKPIFWQAMYKDKEQAKEALLSRKLKTMFTEEVIQLNILMRQIEGEKKVYENVPRIKVHIV